MEDQDYIVFDQYLQGELSLEEIMAFEARLKSDAQFETAFKLYKDLSSHLQHKIENETETYAFRENVKNISKTHFNNTKTALETPKKSKVFKLGQLAIAASVAILLGVFIFNQFSNPVYSDYNTHEPMTVIRGASGMEEVMEATKAFNKGDYAKANDLLKLVLGKDPENKELQLYYAITNIELNHFKVADALLIDLSQGHSAYSYKATWYAALSQLKQKNQDQAILWLKQIPKGADDYIRAKKLINKLE